MQINKPDKGIFKGIGPLQKQSHINRRNFPFIRNKNQFQFTHNHGNFYESSFDYFHKSKFYSDKLNHYKYQKVKKNSNTSQILLGADKNDFKSLNQKDYRKQVFQNHKPPKLIYHKQQGVSLSNPNQPSSTSLFKTSNQQQFSTFREFSSQSKQNITYKNWRGDIKFNPITGQSKDIKKTFGYEDFKFKGESQRKYKSNNYTRMPINGEKYDIISGRRLMY